MAFYIASGILPNFNKHALGFNKSETKISYQLKKNVS